MKNFLISVIFLIIFSTFFTACKNNNNPVTPAEAYNFGNYTLNMNYDTTKTTCYSLIFIGTYGRSFNVIGIDTLPGSLIKTPLKAYYSYDSLTYFFKGNCDSSNVQYEGYKYNYIYMFDAYDYLANLNLDSLNIWFKFIDSNNNLLLKVHDIMEKSKK